MDAHWTWEWRVSNHVVSTFPCCAGIHPPPPKKMARESVPIVLDSSFFFSLAPAALLGLLLLPLEFLVVQLFLRRGRLLRLLLRLKGVGSVHMYGRFEKDASPRVG